MTELSPPGNSEVAEYIPNLWYTFNIVKEVLSHGGAEVTAASGSAVTTLRRSFSPLYHSLSCDTGECWRSGGHKIELAQCSQEQLLHTRAARWGIAEDDLETSHLSSVQRNATFNSDAVV